jgi:tetratricopeptide (TPR) repeat protein
MNAQISVKTKRSVPMLLLGPLIIALLSSFNPVAFFSNACVSPFASAYDRAVALDSYGDKTGAIAAYSEHLRDHPDDVDALFSRGIAYVRLRQPDLAIADLAEVLRRRPHEFGAARWRGDAYLLKHDYAAAVADYTRTMEQPGVDPTLFYPFYPRGLAALGAGRYELAQADFAKEIAGNAANTYAAKGRDCAARESRDGECSTLPLDPNPDMTRIIGMGIRTTSDCYSGPAP